MQKKDLIHFCLLQLWGLGDWSWSSLLNESDLCLPAAEALKDKIDLGLENKPLLDLGSKLNGNFLSWSPVSVGSTTLSGVMTPTEGHIKVMKGDYANISGILSQNGVLESNFLSTGAGDIVLCVKVS